MSNIDKQALREIAAAAVGAHERLSVMPPDDIFDISLAEGTQLDADITALNALNSAANPTTVLALLDELEAKDKRLNEILTPNMLLPVVDDMDADNLRHVIKTTSENYSLLHAKWEAAEKRIAELEAREVKLPELKMLSDYLAEVTMREREDILVGIRLELFRALEEAGVKVAAAGKGEASWH